MVFSLSFAYNLSFPTELKMTLKRKIGLHNLILSYYSSIIVNSFSILLFPTGHGILASPLMLVVSDYFTTWIEAYMGFQRGQYCVVDQMFCYSQCHNSYSRKSVGSCRSKGLVPQQHHKATSL